MSLIRKPNQTFTRADARGNEGQATGAELRRNLHHLMYIKPETCDPEAEARNAKPETLETKCTYIQP